MREGLEEDGEEGERYRLCVPVQGHYHPRLKPGPILCSNDPTDMKSFKGIEGRAGRFTDIGEILFRHHSALCGSELSHRSRVAVALDISHA